MRDIPEILNWRRWNDNISLSGQPTEDQLAEWKEAGGYQRSEWDEFKVDLAGSMENFAKMEEAAGTQGKYFVHDA